MGGEPVLYTDSDVDEIVRDKDKRITDLEADNARLRDNLSKARNHAADLARIIEDVANLRPVRRFDSAPHLSEVARIAQEQSNASLQKYRADNERLEAEVKRLSGTLHGAHVLSMDAALKDNRRQAKEIERLRSALLEISEHMSGDWTGDVMRKIARRALDEK